MKRIIEVPGKITDRGELIAENASVLRSWIDNSRGKNVQISIQHYGSKRSSPQNRYYWGVVVKMIKDRFSELGHDLSEEETHDFLKKEYNFKEIKTDTDYYFKIPQSTTKQDTVEFDNYIERIRQFAAIVLNIVIPDPDINYKSLINFK